MEINIETVVIYHGGCPDGTSAAWALSLALDNDKTYYHGGKHKEKYPDVQDKNVIFVDFAYPLEQMIMLLQQAKSVLVLDHHATSKKLQFITDTRLTLTLDMNRSGAQMAWDYAANILRGKLNSQHVPAKYGSTPAGDSPVNYQNSINELLSKGTRPWFIEDIGDRDLWRWQIPESKNTTRRMFSMGIYENLNNFYNLCTVDRNQIAKDGAILNADDDRIYAGLVRKAIDCIITTTDCKQSWKVRAVECDHSYASEVGNQLVQDQLCDFSLMYRYDIIKDEWWISCRALPISDIDLTKIIPLFDPLGGGHPKAAGMTLFGATALRNMLKPASVKFTKVAENTADNTSTTDVGDILKLSPIHEKI